MNNYKKIQVYSNPRSGSTYFAGMMELYLRQYSVLNEPLNPSVARLESEEIFVASANEAIKQINNTDYIIVKNHALHLSNIYIAKYPELIERYLEIPFYNIGLFRRSVFDLLVSLIISRKTKVWGPPYTYKDTTMTITKEEFDIAAEICLRNFNVFIDNKFGIKFDEVHYYEDLHGYPCMDFGNLEMCPVMPNMLVKHTFGIEMRTPDKRDVISNFDDMAIWLNQYLDEHNIHDVLDIDENFMIQNIKWNMRNDT
jgi:hypothetical protein